MLHFQSPKLNIVSRDGRCGMWTPTVSLLKPQMDFALRHSFQWSWVRLFRYSIKQFNLLSKLNDFYILDFETEK